MSVEAAGLVLGCLPMKKNFYPALSVYSGSCLEEMVIFLIHHEKADALPHPLFAE
jgi:hypothetical protein